MATSQVQKKELTTTTTTDNNHDFLSRNYLLPEEPFFLFLKIFFFKFSDAG